MTYVIGTLTFQSNIEMPKAYEVFCRDAAFEEHPAGQDACDVRIESAPAAPDLSDAVRRAVHELMIVWEKKDAWVYESKDRQSYVTVSRDYSHALCYSSAEDPVSSLQPLLQALVECCFVYSGTAVIHASCVSKDGKAVLFSATSGTGKSARAQGWAEYLDAGWISGDRPAVHPALKIVHGVPWDGKDQIFVNTSAPIQAVAEIRRSDRTYARALTVRQKRNFLAAQLLIPMWDPILVQSAFAAMKQMIDQLPIYRLYCDMTEESVRQAYEILFHSPEKILEAKEDSVMKMKKDFTIVDVTGDYMAVPVGENAAEFGGTVVLNEISAFLLKAMNKPVTEEELLERLLNEYDVDRETAAADLKEILATLNDMGLVE